MKTHFAATVLACSLATAAHAGQEIWQFDLTTQGEDASWTSPTSLDPQAPQYHGTYELTVIEVGIAWNGIPFGVIDVTDQVPEKFLEGEQVVAGPAPILLLDGPLVYPEPPEDPAIAATVRVELDGDGFGRVSVMDVALGTVVVDLGGFIGEQEVEITSIRVAGTLEIQPQTPQVPGDLTGDGVVDVSDLLVLLSAWGGCPSGSACPADLTGDGAVDVSDLLALLGNWG